MAIESRKSIVSEVFGRLPDGTEIRSFTLSNASGMRVKIINFGAIIAECWVPDRTGQCANVALGFDNLEQYVAKHPRFGSTIGRYANRISNAQFEIDGVTYRLTPTKGTTSTHGGVLGFDKKVWDVIEAGENESESWLTLHYLSKDMEEGFPGNLDVSIRFTLWKNSNDLILRYTARTDKATPVNLTNHSYFNLKGAANGNILDHMASFNASHYTPLNDEMLPTGEVAPVKDTPYDFTEKRQRIGDRINDIAGGYDINLVIDMRPGDIEGLGSVVDPTTGRCLTVYTDQPAFQFFTANQLDGSISGVGGAYPKYGGFCLETQCYPNSVNQPNFPSSILRPDGIYGHYTQFSFSNLPEGAL
jgi:aldose 1-epimerase